VKITMSTRYQLLESLLPFHVIPVEETWLYIWVKKEEI
jgi:hypothetical protein